MTDDYIELAGWLLAAYVSGLLCGYTIYNLKRMLELL